MRPFTRQSLAAMSEEARELMISAVADLGEKAITDAFKRQHRGWGRPKGSKEKAWYSETGNLHDSFGSAVYINGVLRKDTIRYVDNNTWSTESDSRYGRGRDAVNNYLERIKPTSKKNEVYLVCVAAMPYANALERGTHAGGYEIRVISGARDYIDAHWHEIESKVYAKMGLRKPASRIKRGDVKLYNDAGYER